jgi:hypothetical protein
MMLKRVQPFSRIIMIEESLVAPKNVLRRSDDIMRKEKIRT